MDKTPSIELRGATEEDIQIILNICDDARCFQRNSGFPQWSDGYPSREVIENDIAAAIGFIILANGKIIGYCVIDCNGDKDYDEASGLWNFHGAYAAIHRLALSHDARGRHLGKPSLECILDFIANQYIYNVRVDTGVENAPMKRLLASLDFVCRGEYNFSWGQRLAYEKALDSQVD